MKKPSSLSRRLRAQWTRRFHPVPDEMPFFIILVVVMIGLYVWALLTSAELHDPLRLVLFTVLIVIHTFLHLLSPILSRQNRWRLLYLVGQGIIAFVLTILSRVPGLPIGLYMALIGEAVGILGANWAGVIGILAYIGMAGLSFFFMVGTGSSWGYWILTTIPVAAFVATYVILYTRQAEARERAQTLLEELEIAHQQLSEYAAQVEDLTIAAERQRMARELHDTLAQGLAGLVLQLEAIDSHLSANRIERAQEIVRQAIERARGSLADARRAIDNLRVELSLPEAIRQEVERFSATTGIPCALELDGLDDIPETIADTTLKAVSEGLSNVARHARARKAEIQLAVTDQELVAEIRDDGVGFEPYQGAIQTGHYGLLGMRERARLAGGSLEIQSSPGSGTLLIMRLPIRDVPSEIHVSSKP